MMSIYAGLMLLSFLGPFALSFDQKVAFYKKWPGLFAGIILNGIIFIIWDGYFAKNEIWGFNEKYILPYRFNHLPIEEWSFFFVVPYASVFIYSCLKAYLRNEPFIKHKHLITLWFAVIVLVIGFLHYERTYTFVNLLIAGALLLINYYFKPAYMGYFWMAYLVHLLPFLIVNGILTGAVTSEPIVWYNDNENLGIRLFTIPVEDTIYALTCLLLPINVMEYVNSRIFRSSKPVAAS
jgi:lycopene cyclase domain-containing protein